MDEVAAEWFEIRDEMSPEDRIVFHAWLAMSVRHVEAYLRIAAINQRLRDMDAERLFRALTPEVSVIETNASDKESNRWQKLKDRPFAIIAGVVMLTAATTWAVSDKLIVQPLRERIEVLQADLNDARAGVATVQAGKSQKPGSARP